MKKSILFYIFSILFILSSFSFAEEKFYFCHKLVKEPILDGRLDDTAWKNICKATYFVKLGGNSSTSKQTYFKIGYTLEALYIGVKCDESEIEKIKAKLKDGNIDICLEDSVEFFLFPPRADNYYQFMINAIGSRWNGIGIGPPYFSLQNWQAKTYKGKDYYSVEIKIPWGIFRKIPENKETWKGNICRNILTSGDRFTTWSHLKASFHEPANFGKIIFVDEISSKEREKAEGIIINFLKKEIVANLKSVSLYRKEVPQKVNKYPSLQKEIASFLKNYEEIEKGVFQLDTVKKAYLLLEKSKHLSKDADELKRKLLLQTFFDCLGSDT